MHELEKVKIESKMSNDVLMMLNELLNESFYNRKNRSSHSNNQADKDLNKVLENVQKYLKTLKEKERDVREKERDMDAKKLQLNIIERELAIIKQKFKIQLANPSIEAEFSMTQQPVHQAPVHFNKTEDKENDQGETPRHNSSATKKSDMNIDKALQVQNITGLKRNLDELITGPTNKPKTEKKLPHGSLKLKKDKRDKFPGKTSVGRLSEIPAGLKLEDYEMKNPLIAAEDLLGGYEELKKKMKMEN